MKTLREFIDSEDLPRLVQDLEILRKHSNEEDDKHDKEISILGHHSDEYDFLIAIWATKMSKKIKNIDSRLKKLEKEKKTSEKKAQMSNDNPPSPELAPVR